MAGFVVLGLTPPSGVPRALAVPAVSGTSFTDNFSQDSSLNTALWQVNGSAGYLFGLENCPACASVLLDPSFSLAGMTISQVSSHYAVGTIQSVANLTPPFTVTALVEGLVSNGHPFVFGITNSNATQGVQVTANLNPADCSAETACSDPSTCGTPANPSIPPDQCYYGVYGRVGTGGTTWGSKTYLDRTPGTDVEYSITVIVAASGDAQYTLGVDGTILGEANATVGTGPFYIVMAQSEGAPVPGPGPNEAVWSLLSVSPTAAIRGTTSGPSSPITWPIWLILILAVASVIVLIVVLLAYRDREFIVDVLDAGSSSPIPGATVRASGPRDLSGTTRDDGQVNFGRVRKGEYTLNAGATGYTASPPLLVEVRGNTEYAVRLGRSGSKAATEPVLSAEPSRPSAPSPVPTSVATSVGVASPSPAAPEEPSDDIAWGGPRIREVIQEFRAKGAVSPQTARTAEELGLSRLFVRIMRRRRGKTRVFVEVDGKYYLDEEALHHLR